ncbi:MoaD/ThiS family protein [Mycolicibacterium arenosum]|uniref:Molybdopterin synthase sulfur carrier subunit n=1 Tax=Mycolicibacterium arenosum TaxID=2952157 RepID=A0ABT1M171_9MYCO|nr:MoaD/ThiS family protein [Mycolicibacterium sp. CAU 1645]
MQLSIVHITVRYFAAARAAAGVDEESLDVTTDASIDDLVAILSARGPELARVLARCSFLCDGVAVRDRSESLRTNRTVDVLPPFAGG